MALCSHLDKQSTVTYDAAYEIKHLFFVHQKLPRSIENIVHSIYYDVSIFMKFL